MVAKKSPKANLENKRTISLLLGFVFALSMVYIAFEWSNKDMKTYRVKQVIVEPPIMPEIPPTKENVPPPPPPPKPIIVEVINMVDNDKTVEVLPDSLFVENDKPVEIPIYIPPKEDDTDIVIDFIKVEKKPVFKDDLAKFLGKNLRYPLIAAENEIHGRVICEFVVNKDGSISDVKIIKGIDPSLDEEAVRVISMMPNWEPGIQQGKPVRVKYHLPVTFKLE